MADHHRGVDVACPHTSVHPQWCLLLALIPVVCYTAVYGQRDEQGPSQRVLHALFDDCEGLLGVLRGPLEDQFIVNLRCVPNAVSTGMTRSTYTSAYSYSRRMNALHCKNGPFLMMRCVSSRHHGCACDMNKGPDTGAGFEQGFKTSV